MYYLQQNKCILRSKVGVNIPKWNLSMNEKAKNKMISKHRLVRCQNLFTHIRHPYMRFILSTVNNVDLVIFRWILVRMSPPHVLSFLKCMICCSEKDGLLGSSQVSSPQHKPHELQIHPGQQSANGKFSSEAYPFLLHGEMLFMIIIY